MGDGTTTSAAVPFPKGIAVVTMNHTGNGRFRVQMEGQNSSFDKELAEGTGGYKGSTGVMVNQAGEYVFSVKADGHWQIDVLWPTPTTAPVFELPYQYSGTGDQAVYFVLVQTGPHTLTMTYDGAKSFSVQSMTSEGRNYIERFRGSGPSTASMEFTIRDKAFEFLMFNVRADANWTLDIK
jgi:hypothetical protein